MPRSGRANSAVSGQLDLFYGSRQCVEPLAHTVSKGGRTLGAICARKSASSRQAVPADEVEPALCDTPPASRSAAQRFATAEQESQHPGGRRRARCRPAVLTQGGNAFHHRSALHPREGGGLHPPYIYYLPLAPFRGPDGAPTDAFALVIPVQAGIQGGRGPRLSPV